MDNHSLNTITIIHSDLQQAQKIARMIREMHYFSEIINHNDVEDYLKKHTPKLILTDNQKTLYSNNNLFKNIEIIDLSILDIEQKESILQIESVIKKNNYAQTWTSKNIIDYHIQEIQKTVADEEVILALSGGVDSSVVAALLQKAIGDQLTCVFVDTGLMRLNEGDNIMRAFSSNLGIKLIRIDAEQRFLDALSGISDPEQKRKIIGKLFIDIFEEEASKLSSAKWLAQGTIYPDILESLHTKDGVAVKSHHNVGGLPEKFGLKLIEPLRDLFKNEVRVLGVELGLPYEMVNRHPFPGPGLGVRILGAIKKEYADILRLADHIFIDELYKEELYYTVSQAFAVFLPVKSVGVVNNTRVYDYVISLRAIETLDFMSARAAHLPFSLLERVSNRIIAEVSGVSRVTYDISDKPPATIEWE